MKAKNVSSTFPHNYVKPCDTVIVNLQNAKQLLDLTTLRITILSQLIFTAKRNSNYTQTYIENPVTDGRRKKCRKITVKSV
jgi:hypothetical protein